MVQIDMKMPENCEECEIKSWDEDGYACPFSGIPTLNIGRQDDCPLVEVPERKEGHWKLLRNGNAICSECGFTQVSAWDMDGWDNFCHHCGADMRGEQNEPDKQTDR